MRWWVCAICCCLLGCSPGARNSDAGRALVRVAVASNFQQPQQELEALFEAQTPYTVESSFASTAKLFAQIQNGGPFDVFLAAHAQHPRQLVEEERAIRESVFTFAVGRLALMSNKKQNPAEIEAQLRAGAYQHLSIAKPELAPYGLAAREALERLGLWEGVSSRLVFGDNITQAYQFVSSGSAELGFVALSQVKQDPEAAYWLVPQELHAPILQDAVLLKHAREAAGARAFLEFLRSDAAREIIARYGYELQKVP